VAAVTSARVELVARHEHQRAAHERLGASVDLSDGYDVVIDAVGFSSSMGRPSRSLGLAGAWSTPAAMGWAHY
jgi:hypothetical protein